MSVDRNGAFYFVDRFTPGGSNDSGVRVNQQVIAGLVTQKVAAELFTFHSSAGSRHVLFLEFDGHDIKQSAWNDGQATLFQSAAYSLDNDFLSFSHRARTAILEIWLRVAQDYSPFDVDVTTEDPGKLDPTVRRVLITRNWDLDNRPMPVADGANLAYLIVWGSPYFSAYSPGLVYHNQLADQADTIAISHQLEHTCGLGHPAQHNGADWN